jgi:hypothetical protein
MSQKTYVCRNNPKQKTRKKLERAENRRNFASQLRNKSINNKKNYDYEKDVSSVSFSADNVCPRNGR